MRQKKTLFKSKISRRIFATFIACSILPITCISFLVYFQVTKHLTDQTIKSLHQAVKSHSKLLVDRLSLIENELQLVQSGKGNNIHLNSSAYHNIGTRLSNQFNSIALHSNANQLTSILNQPTARSIKFESDDIEHMTTGNSLLMELKIENSNSSIIILSRTISEQNTEDFVIGEINMEFLWSINQVENLPMDTEICVLDSSNNILYSSLSNIAELGGTIGSKSQSATSGHFEFHTNGELYFASYSQLFLKPTYKLPHWTVVLLKAKSDAFAPISEFKIIFPLFVVLSFLVVLWLSIKNIRKNLVPISVLKEGVNRITQRDFSKKVSIASKDEFEELAFAFNQMSFSIEHKLKTLNAKAEIDHAVLSAINREDIIKIAVTHIRGLITCNVCGISFINSNDVTQGTVLCGFKKENSSILSNTFQMPSLEYEKIKQNTKHCIIRAGDSIPKFLAVTSGIQNQDLFLLPIWVNKLLSAVLWFGVDSYEHVKEDDITLARQLADQIAVALSNSSLIEDLKEMNWGTLQALARAVDTKSSWTAGHSHRVTQLALKIGNELQLKPEAMENLRRAGFLHDIGKVGVPSAILDKPSELSDDEFRIIKRHPELGVKILAPIKAYKELIPMVGQHHERFDGKGYPDGLSGNAINIGARILAVADVYDALSSDRPYRKGMPLDKIIDLIVSEAGHQFDPLVVTALIEVLKEMQQRAA
jgi:putative nucleotidyltransferase with HDIG domain